MFTTKLRLLPLPETFGILGAFLTGTLVLKLAEINPLWALPLLGVAGFSVVSFQWPLAGLLAVVASVIFLEDIPMDSLQIFRGQFNLFYRWHLPLFHFTPLEAMLLLLALAVFVRSRDSERFLPETRFTLPLAAFIACAAGGVIYSAVWGVYLPAECDLPVTIAINEFRPLSYVPLAGWLFYRIVRSQEDLMRLLKVVLALLLARGAVGVARYVLGIGVVESFGVRVFLGDELLFFVCAILFMVAWLLKGPGRGLDSRLLLGSGLLLMAFCLLFSFIREMEVGALFGLGLLFFRWTSDGRSRVRYGLVVLVLAIAVALWSGLLQRDSSQAWHAAKYHSFRHWRQSYSFQYRWIETKNALRTWWEHPWFGVGMGGRWEVYEPLPRLYRQTNTHNFYLFVLLHLGVAGLAIFAWFFRRVGEEIRALRTRISRPEEQVYQAFLAGAAVSLQSLALICVTGPCPTFSRSAVWIGFLLGVLAVLHRSADQNRLIEAER